MPNATNSRVGERRIIGYGGSQSFQSPNSLYGPGAKELLRELGVDIKRFETAFDRELYPSLGLSRGLFFTREAFGRDALVTGDAPRMNADEAARRQSNAKPLAEFVAEFPISEASKAQYLALYSADRDPLAGRSTEEKRAHPQAHQLSRLPHQDLRLQRGGRQRLPGPHARLLRARRRRGAGRGRARSRLSGICRAWLGEANAAWSEPYIYHFPDGNASLARLLVRSLIPGVAPGEHHGRRGAGAVRLRQAR